MTADFGLVREIDAQSFGEPGQRTFRLRITGAAFQSASLWLEKEHMGALSMALRQVLSQADYDAQPAAPAEVSGFPETADHDFRVGRIGIGFDPSDRTVALQFEEMSETPGDEVLCRLSLDDSASLARQLEEIVAAGRPVCPLCASPVEPGGHACVRANGHLQQPIPQEDSDEEQD